MLDYRSEAPFDSLGSLTAWALSHGPHKPLAACVKLTQNQTISARTIDMWLDRGQITSASLALSRNNVAADLAAFNSDFPIQGKSWPFLISSAKVRALVANGYSLVLSGPEAWDPGLRSQSFDLAQNTLCAVNTMIFLSPAETAGFMPHRDPDDAVIAIQTAGTKRWNLYDSPPTDWTEEDQSRPIPEALSGELELSVGDVLIIPRGWGHAACAGQQMSVHVSIGINRVDPSHVFRQALANLLRTVPADSTWEKTRELFDEVNSQIESCDPQAVLRDYVTSKYRQDRARLDGPS